MVISRTYYIFDFHSNRSTSFENIEILRILFHQYEILTIIVKIRQIYPNDPLYSVSWQFNYHSYSMKSETYYMHSSCHFDHEFKTPEYKEVKLSANF